MAQEQRAAEREAQLRREMQRRIQTLEVFFKKLKFLFFWVVFLFIQLFCNFRISLFIVLDQVMVVHLVAMFLYLH